MDYGRWPSRLVEDGRWWLRFPSVFSDDEMMCLDNAGWSVGHDGTQIGTLGVSCFTLDPLGWFGLGHLHVHSTPSSRDHVVFHYGQ